MDIGRTAILKHSINTGDAEPLAQTFYKTNPMKKESLRKKSKKC